MQHVVFFLIQLQNTLLLSLLLTLLDLAQPRTRCLLLFLLPLPIPVSTQVFFDRPVILPLLKGKLHQSSLFQFSINRLQQKQRSASDLLIILELDVQIADKHYPS
jgi:hypothetical protein